MLFAFELATLICGLADPGGFEAVNACLSDTSSESLACVTHEHSLGASQDEAHS